MAFTAKQSAVLIDSLIADLVDEAIEQSLAIKKARYNNAAGPCQRLFDALGLLPCTTEDDEDNVNDNDNDNVELAKRVAFKGVDDTVKHKPYFIDPPSSSSLNDEQNHMWHNWLDLVLGSDKSEDELDIDTKKLSDTACQTEQPRSRKRYQGVRTIGDSSLPPCERTRQTIFIGAESVPTAPLLNRPPLGDRFCYMLTDFASALYCSLAIMCCCTPNVFR